ncbi:hypothetical protein D1872_233450 [compost metagenome]
MEREGYGAASTALFSNGGANGTYDQCREETANRPACVEQNDRPLGGRIGGSAVRQAESANPAQSVRKGVPKQRRDGLVGPGRGEKGSYGSCRCRAGDDSDSHHDFESSVQGAGGVSGTVPGGELPDCPGGPRFHGGNGPHAGERRGRLMLWGGILGPSPHQGGGRAACRGVSRGTARTPARGTGADSSAGSPGRGFYRI